MEKRFGFAGFGFVIVTLALLTAAHSNASDDLVYYDRQVHARTWVAPTESNTNHIIKRHPTEQAYRPLAPVATLKLVRNEKKRLWLGKIEVGTPRGRRPQHQIFDLILDTGSPYLWVTSSQTKEPGSSNTYNTGLSSSWDDLHQPFEAKYGAGSCTGVAGSEIVNVGGMKVEMSFGSVTERGERAMVDGILGLSLTPSPKLPDSHFFQAAMNNFPHFTPIAAFCFGKKDPEVHLGQVKEAFLGEKIEYHKVIKLSRIAFELWVIGDGEISVDGTTIVSGSIRTILDTGSGSIFGPPDEVKKIYDKIPKSRIYSKKHGQVQYFIPCKHEAKVSFKWNNGNPQTILPEHLVIQIPGENFWCIGAIVGEMLPYDENPETLWLAGNVYVSVVIYNAKDRLVGLAEAKEGCTNG